MDWRTIDPGTFLTVLLTELLKRKAPDLQNVPSTWFQSIKLELSDANPKYVLVELKVPAQEKVIPAFSVDFGRAESVFEHGKCVYRKLTLRIKV